jgi:hypothetical protein
MPRRRTVEVDSTLNSGSLVHPPDSEAVQGEILITGWAVKVANSWASIKVKNSWLSQNGCCINVLVSPNLVFQGRTHSPELN